MYYDNCANLVNGPGWRYSWEHGRQLASMEAKDGSGTWNFTYNADGLRTSRSNGTTNYKYQYLNGQLVKMTIGDLEMFFNYDAAGVPVSIVYNGSSYYYVTNLQGDVVGIVNQSGNQIVGYTYDAWGNVLTTTGSSANTIGKNNPLRYRGYVYDTETKLYYLQSRYYNPEWGRFINADNYPSTGQGLLGNNMFAYCNNNPVNCTDPTGESGWFIAANAVFGAIVGAITQITSNVITGNTWYSGVVGAAAGGATYNVIAITTGSLVAASAGGSAVEASVNETLSYITGEKELTAENVAGSAANVACKTAENTLTASITGTIASNIVPTNSKWFQPQKFSSSFTGNYAMRVFFQTAVQGEMTMVFNSARTALQTLDSD